MIKKGADPSVIFEILNDNDVKNLKEPFREIEVKKKYSEFFGKTSKETIKANLREEIVVNNQKKRFLVKLPQDLKKLDIMAVHFDSITDCIKITLAQQKGNNASFNSSSEAKTLECISKCVKEKTFTEYFDLLPECYNPIKNGKNYEIDVCIGMINACGEKTKKYNDVEIKYLTNDDYLNHLGLDVNTIDVAYEIYKNSKISEHNYDAVVECKNWEYVYHKCKKKIGIND